MKKAKVAIITALPEEITAVEEHLNDLTEQTNGQDGSVYQIGYRKNEKSDTNRADIWEVFLPQAVP
jgi:hypothetical protein